MQGFVQRDQLRLGDHAAGAVELPIAGQARFAHGLEGATQIGVARFVDVLSRAGRGVRLPDDGLEARQRDRRGA